MKDHPILEYLTEQRDGRLATAEQLLAGDDAGFHVRLDVEAALDAAEAAQRRIQLLGPVVMPPASPRAARK
jgi:hypothetical protein